MLLSSSRLIRPSIRLSSQRLPTLRFLSSTPEEVVPTREPRPPSQFNEEIAMGVQYATRMYMRHGIGKQRLEEIARAKSVPLITKWQKMMEAFLGTQVHVLAGLGYAPTEEGLGTYNYQLGSWLQGENPDTQERMRSIGRDIWREVLCTTFNVKAEDLKEVDIVQARNIMHKVSQQMQDDKTLKMIAKKCMAIEPTDTDEGARLATAAKHRIVQDVLVNEVYLGGEPSLVSEFGFGEGEDAYVYLQCAMAEHQSDPLVAQYVGTAMMKIMTAAGLDMHGNQKKST